MQKKHAKYLANISIKSTLYSGSTMSPVIDSLAKYLTQNELTPFVFFFPLLWLIYFH